jgi:16S rRNA (uracil1498-N3)-methyltransferase
MPSVYHPQLNDNNCISGQEYHHLSRVLRVKPDDVILLNDGKGSLCKAVVKEIDKKCVRFELLVESTYHEPVSPFAIAFSLLKNKHDELIVEKCTELGCTEFYPFISAYSVRKGEDTSRFERIALSAIKQCDNPWLPRVNPVNTLKEAIKQAEEQGYTPVFCSEHRPDIWLSDLMLSTNIKPCFFIGPEGGFNEAEIAYLEQEKLDQITISKLILRAETAAIAIAAQYVSLSKPG